MTIPEKEELENRDIKEIIDWCDEKNHSDQKIMDLLRRIVNAAPSE